MPVTGMSCYNCANTIEVNIRKVPGIIRASVDFASEKLSLTFDSDQIAEREIIASIKRIGYGVAVGKTELPVSGMHDQNDAGTLEKMLLSLEGIIQITVSYATDRASIEYIPGVISISEIAGTIRKAGFDLIDSKDLE